eukprot:m.201027 g.201027  ORF g.201027 m.201027 type:complete len:96 (+) comp14966_c0_seq23:3667-3954(+)
MNNLCSFLYLTTSATTVSASSTTASTYITSVQIEGKKQHNNPKPQTGEYWAAEFVFFASAKPPPRKQLHTVQALRSGCSESQDHPVYRIFHLSIE